MTSPLRARSGSAELARSNLRQGKLEYRVRWRRDGGHMRTAIFQTAAAAMRKAEGILAIEQLLDDDQITRFHGMAPLAEGPELQTREVGAWGPDDKLRAPEASDALVGSMAAYYRSLDAPDDTMYGSF